MSTPSQFRHYLISQDAAGANIELIRSGEQVCVLAFDAKRLCFVQCHVLLEPLKNRAAFDERGRRIAETGHPLAARLLEYGEDDGSPYYITENVDGETLRSLVSRYENLPVWLAQRLTALALAAQGAVVERGDFGAIQPLDALRVLQIGARELRICAADYRLLEPPGGKTSRDKQAKAAFDKQAQFISTYFAEQTAPGGGAKETSILGTTDFMELLHNLLLACAPEVRKEMEALRAKLYQAAPQPPDADIAAPYKPRALLGPLLASYQEVARGVVQTVRVQSQKLDPAQPYALRGTLMKTGQNVFVEQVAPPLLAGMTPGEVLRHARSQPKGGKYPNLVPVISVEDTTGVECVVETAVEGVTLADLLASRGKLEPQEAYVVLAGVDSALAQLEKAGRPVVKLRLDDVFLFTGFGQGRAKDAELLRTKLNEWPGFSIVLRAHPCMHSMSCRGTDPGMLLPPEPQHRPPAEPLWNGGWMAALSLFLIGAGPKAKPATLPAGEEVILKMLNDELANARQGAPSTRSNFLARFARDLREQDQAHKAGGLWKEVSGAPPATQAQGAVVARAAEVRIKPKPMQASKVGPSVPALAPLVPEEEESPIGFAEALIRNSATGNREAMHEMPHAPHDDGEIESSWSGFRQEKPLWLRVALWSLVAIALGGLLAHMQGRAFWQGRGRPQAPFTPDVQDGLPSAPPGSTPATPLLPPPPSKSTSSVPPKPKSTTPDALTARLKKIRLAGDKLPEDLRPNVEKAAHAGNTEAMLALGNALLSGDTSANDERAAFGWFQKALQAGDNNARLPLAQCYLQGWGTQADHPHAVALLTTAAKAGEGAAKDLLGVCYSRGLGVPRDDARAFQLCMEAHEAGVPSACGNLGNMYLRGQGVTADPAQAVKLFAEGSKKGNAESMLQYARCLENGTGIAIDVGEATSWYLQAAKAGNAEAMAWCQQHHVAY
jgi:hypothetical protein